MAGAGFGMRPRAWRAARPAENKGRRLMRIKGLLTIVSVLAGLLVAAPAVAQGAAPATPVCATCHEAAHLAIASTHHGAKNDAQGSMCQACHGDASAHLKDPSNKPE